MAKACIESEEVRKRVKYADVMNLIDKIGEFKKSLTNFTNVTDDFERLINGVRKSFEYCNLFLWSIIYYIFRNRFQVYLFTKEWHKVHC